MSYFPVGSTLHGNSFLVGSILSDLTVGSILHKYQLLIFKKLHKMCLICIFIEYSQTLHIFKLTTLDTPDS